MARRPRSFYGGLSFRPPAPVAAAARRALERRAQMPPSNRGMTPVGLARAWQLLNRQELSPTTTAPVRKEISEEHWRGRNSNKQGDKRKRLKHRTPGRRPSHKRETLLCYNGNAWPYTIVKKLFTAFFFSAIAFSCIEAKSQGVQFGTPQPRSSITPFSLDVVAECKVYGKNIRKPTLIRQQGVVYLYSCQEADSYSVPIDKTGFTPPYPVIRVYGGKTEKVGETRGRPRTSAPRPGTGSGIPNSAYNCSLIPGKEGSCSIPTQKSNVFGGSKVGEW